MYLHWQEQSVESQYLLNTHKSENVQLYAEQMRRSLMSAVLLIIHED